MKTILKYVGLTLLGIALYRLCSINAFEQRGYYAVGGEVFTLFLPVFYYFIEEAVRDVCNMRKQLKEEQGDD